MVADPQLAERMRRVALLLDSRYDYLPPVRVTDFGDAPGPAPSRRVPCPDCDARGSVWVKEPGRAPRMRMCQACDGQRWRRRAKGEREYDEYLEAPLDEARVGVAGVVSVEEEVRRLTGSIERIQAVLDSKAGYVDHERFGWEKARAVMYRQGSYGELDRAVTVLASRFPEYKRMLALRHELALALTAREMRGHVRVPAWLMYERSVSQAPTVARLKAEGRSSSEVARILRIPKRKAKLLLKAA